MPVQTITEKSSLFKNVLDSRLSEGCLYSATHQKYYWIDVFKATIFSCGKDKSDFKECQIIKKEGSFPERVGFVVPSKGDADVVYFGAKYGLAKANLKTGSWEYLALYSTSGLDRDWDRMRSNDGNTDPNDSSIIYAGIMNDFHVGDCTLEGAVVKFVIKDSGISCECVYDGIRIPNSINFVGNEKIYLTDSLNFQILEIPYESKDWKNDAIKAIDIKKYNEEFDSPEPDGSFILGNKYFVTAVWSTCKVQVYELETYSLVYEYIVPDIDRISCCALAAETNKIIVTTASQTVDEAGTTEESLHGAVFLIEMDQLVSDVSPNSKDGKTHI
uniref:SMP-30/Gluconolactonase/LRE-like region domain-containing protein n=1 Tax=Hanseniaspora opuntiae TaxID=211096 RepID=A0A1E5R907_9ASCO